MRGLPQAALAEARALCGATLSFGRFASVLMEISHIAIPRSDIPRGPYRAHARLGVGARAYACACVHEFSCARACVFVDACVHVSV